MFAVQDACWPEPCSPVHEGSCLTAVPDVLCVLRTSQLPFGELAGVEKSCSLGTDVPFRAWKLGKNKNAHISSFLKSCFSCLFFSYLWLLAYNVAL